VERAPDDDRNLSRDRRNGARVMHPLIEHWRRFTDHMSNDFLGGPKVIKLSWSVNLQKAGTLPFVLALMFAFDNFSTTAWIYAVLHGSYGLCWLLKDLVFPDPNWERKVTFGAALNSWLLVLGLYWIAPVIVVVNRVEQPLPVLASASILYVLGIVVMMVADAQKYFVLKAKRGLITDGMFARVRHPNYLGEMMLYGAFAIVAGHVVPWLVLAWVWLGVFVPNMLQKEARMSRYPEWSSYVARSGFLLPKIFRSATKASTDQVAPTSTTSAEAST
jgi:protein-S-isoprenylcysteine O-methyltransferase Ste14